MVCKSAATPLTMNLCQSKMDQSSVAMCMLYIFYQFVNLLLKLSASSSLSQIIIMPAIGCVPYLKLIAMEIAYRINM